MQEAIVQTNFTEINSKAIASLLHGQHMECIMALKLALQRFRTENSTEGYTQTKISSTIRTVALPTAESKCFDGVFAMFGGAFVFVDENDAEDLECHEEVDQHLIPAVLLYNMGICYHQEAMRRSGGCSVGLHKASRCYSHALTLLQVFSHELRQVDMLLLAALANNQTHIAAHFMNQEGTQVFGKMLADILDHTNVDEQLEEEEAHEFFSLNVMIVSELDVHRVAPAA